MLTWLVLVDLSAKESNRRALLELAFYNVANAFRQRKFAIFVSFHAYFWPTAAYRVGALSSKSSRIV